MTLLSLGGLHLLLLFMLGLPRPAPPSLPPTPPIPYHLLPRCLRYTRQPRHLSLVTKVRRRQGGVATSVAIEVALVSARCPARKSTTFSVPLDHHPAHRFHLAD